MVSGVRRKGQRGGVCAWEVVRWREPEVAAVAGDGKK